MLTDRLKNVMDLAFSTVNINDSQQTRQLTEATVRDSAAMKQISYLTMIFLPASFLASVFGMNVEEFSSGGYQTLAHYAEVTLSLTLFTIYTVVTLQTQSSFHDRNAPFLRRAVWPILTFQKMMCKTKEKTVEDIV
jgi:Mg2+ and Co2+ transporter CorA